MNLIFTPAAILCDLQVGHMHCQRIISQSRCPAATRQSNSHDETDEAKEAAWLLDDEDFVEEEEGTYGEDEGEGPGISGRLQAFKGVRFLAIQHPQHSGDTSQEPPL